MTVNLTKLAETRSKMGPMSMLDPMLGVGHDADEDRKQQSAATHAGIVATHNAADVLIEVARAALDALSDLRSLSTEDITLDSGSCRYVVRMIPAAEVNRIAAGLLVALPKVSL